jgi:DNA-directed RNA polymerase subunit RPC12/RpoP
MENVTVTCLHCGKTQAIANSPESLRNPKCPACGGPMVVKRRPGDVSQMPCQ